MRPLSRFTPAKRRLVCIDSDGCAFDTMEIKHKECFCPAYIGHFSLQPISKYAREAWEYTNLYSTSRGMHRFITLLLSLDLLSCRREVCERGFTVPEREALRRWIDEAPRLSNDLLLSAAKARPEAPVLLRAYEWSLDVNERIGHLVHGIPPFPHVASCLQALHAHADIVVVSATQEAALAREWAEHGLDAFVDCLCGQETGGKQAVIARLASAYTPDHILMIGDAPGDRQAAEANNAHFYPIRPGEESESWQEFAGLIDAFLRGAYAGAVEQACISRFETRLPSTPPWQAAARIPV